MDNKRKRNQTNSLFPLAVLALAVLVPSARASFVFNIYPVAGNVVLVGNGTLDLTDLTSAGPNTQAGLLWPDFFLGSVAVGGPSTSASVAEYTGIVGPASFGTGGETAANSGTGQTVGIVADDGFVVPTGYVSGSALADTSIFTSATLASLGLTPGTYTYTWGTGPHADSFIVNISATTLPEPASWMLLTMAGALFTLGYLARERWGKAHRE
jgi:hypothetical protein